MAHWITILLHHFCIIIGVRSNILIQGRPFTNLPINNQESDDDDDDEDLSRARAVANILGCRLYDYVEVTPCSTFLHSQIVRQSHMTAFSGYFILNRFLVEHLNS